jgi:acyl-coenzyme A thioesterase PaaI-like protein
MSDAQTIRPPWYGTGRNHCFGCATNNPAGLALKMVESEEGLACDFSLTRLHESYPGLIHGGVSAAILDEVMGNLVIQREKKVCFTAGLRITYAGALRIGEPYRAVAWIHERPADPTTGLYKVLGEIRDGSSTALVMARASFQWMTVAAWRRAVQREDEPNPDLLPMLRQDP